MLVFTTGNLLFAKAEALVNTVNTVGVMGKGIALMFKEQYPENMKLYKLACKRGEVEVGRMFVTRRTSFVGPRWIINFPTKKHWRNPSNIEWIVAGLLDLKRVIVENNIRSVALPPLGSGNGGLDWNEVRSHVLSALSDINDVEITVFEPTSKYQNVVKRTGSEKLTPASALVAELLRRYSILGFQCTLLEVHKLMYLLEETIALSGIENPLSLQFSAGRYGPYALRLNHLLDALDGSYLHCDKRISDADPFDVVRFEDSKRDAVAVYLTTHETKKYRPALEQTTELIDGFESPLGLELLATVHWLTQRVGVEPSYGAIVRELESWPGGNGSGARKLRLFDRRLIDLALERLGKRDSQTL